MGTWPDRPNQENPTHQKWVGFQQIPTKRGEIGLVSFGLPLKYQPKGLRKQCRQALMCENRDRQIGGDPFDFPNKSFL